VGSYEHGTPEQREAIIVLPGILAYAEVQTAYVTEPLKRDRDVYYVNFVARYWDEDAIGNEIIRHIKDGMSDYDHITIFGVSVGGQLCTVLAEKLLKANISGDRMKIDIVEAPFGADTLKTMPKFLRPLFRSRRGSKIAAGLGNHIGALLIKAIFGHYDAKNVEYPDEAFGQKVAYDKAILKECQRGLSGHKWTLLVGQLHYMANPPASISALRQFPVTYVACISKRNGVVVQPLARKRWRKALPNAEFARVRTDHAAFLKEAPTWRKELNELLNPAPVVEPVTTE
jgi:pimeloyl-ACP methyl ester carboxylesterase